MSNGSARRPFFLAALLTLTLGMLTAPAALAGAGAPNAEATTSASSSAPKIGHSGLPVPRFVALKKDEVRARFGPSFDYPVAAVYRRQGLPLRVIAETRDDAWRRVEDADGQKLWIHRSMLMSNENAVVQAEEAVLRAKPEADAMGRARLTQGVVAQMERCEDGWCRLRAGDFKGWVPADQLWGAPRG